MLQHAIDGLEVFFGLIVKALGLGFELLESAFGVDVDGVLGMLAEVKLCLELLWCLVFATLVPVRQLGCSNSVSAVQGELDGKFGSDDDDGALNETKGGEIKYAGQNVRGPRFSESP